MRAEASRHHPGAGVRWISDALPELATVTRSGISFDVILPASSLKAALTKPSRSSPMLDGLCRGVSLGPALPSDRLLSAAQVRIVEWWERAFTSENFAVRKRFWLEAVASLPSMNPTSGHAPVGGVARR